MIKRVQFSEDGPGMGELILPATELEVVEEATDKTDSGSPQSVSDALMDLVSIVFEYGEESVFGGVMVVATMDVKVLGFVLGGIGCQ
jgi:hypothetical protein